MREDILPIGSIEIDKEFADLIPPLAKDELAQLEASILKDGLLTPIVVWGAGGRLLILDGYNRFNICKKHNLFHKDEDPDDPEHAHILVPVAIADLPDREAALLWIEENQTGRRNLTDDQRAMIWASILERREKISRANAAATARAAKADPSVAVKTAATERKPREEEKAAAESKIPASKLRTAKKLRKANPKAADAVRGGKKTLRQARREMKAIAPTFLPELKVGDDVVLKDHDGIEQLRTVTKQTPTYIFIDKSAYYRKTDHRAGLAKDGYYHGRILRIATTDDKQRLAARNTEHTELVNKLRELGQHFTKGQIEFSGYADDDLKISAHFKGISFEQLEAMLETLQPAPALVG